MIHICNKYVIKNNKKVNIDLQNLSRMIYLINESIVI